MNRIVFYLIAYFWFFLATLGINTKESQHFSIDPSTTIIACDIDEVVISGREQNYTQWLMVPSRWSFALTVKKVRKKHKLYDPMHIIQKIKELYPKFSKKADEFKKIIGTAHPKKKTVSLLQGVAKQGFAFVAASNMSKGTYGMLLHNNVLPKQLFSATHYFVKTKKCNKKADGSYHEKPDLEYFNNLKRYIIKKYPHRSFKHILFIDDKKKNVKAARKAGLIAIHYKNSGQLKRRLEQLGISI